MNLSKISYGVLLALPAAQAQDYTWMTNNRAVTITSYIGSGGAVTIPDTITGLPVTSIGDMAFAYNAGVSSVILPNSVSHIGIDAFRYCEAMTNLALGNGVATIEEGALSFCSKLAGLTLPDSLTHIGSFVFGGCARLTNVAIPRTVTRIGYGAFLYCTDLRAITVDSLNPLYSSLDGVLFNDDLTILLAYPPGRGDSYSIPAGTLTVGDSAFYGCASLASVLIPSTVSSIERFAFNTCRSLTNATLPANLANIGGYAFSYCHNLTEVTIPAKVTSIGDGAFNSCTSLTAIMVEADNPYYTSLDGVLFDHERTRLLQYPAGKAGSCAIPVGVTTIGDAAFAGCYNLTGITIPNGILRIPGWAFDFCNSLTSVVIPDTVTSIGYSAFRSCRHMTNVTVGSKVSNIEGRAFGGCFLLQTVHCAGDAPSVGDNAFDGDDQAVVYYLPGTTGWADTYGGRPTALWVLPNPLILTSGPSFGVQTNGFGFTISWATNTPVVVEACADPANPNWSPVGTNTLTDGSCLFSDPEWSSYSARFYRIRSL